MCSIYSLQFYLYTFCIYIFTLCTYVFYYSDFISISNTKEIYFDYIIVGSGTAGSLITHRLSTETNFTYILVEAGGPSVHILDVPVIGPLLHGSIYDWQYETAPQEGACLAMVDRKCSLLLGKIVGGSAKLNNMVYYRGHIAQYVDWFYNKYDHAYFENHFDYIESKILPIEDLIYESELGSAIIEASKELGYKEINIKSNSTGFMKAKLNQRFGKRWSAYHTLSENKHNIITNAEVETVLIKHNIAYGVKYRKNGITYKLFAKKGVILSAGTINTVKVLQLSGVGPADILNKYGIPVKSDLPVGKNLQEHVTTGLDLVVFNKSIGIDGLDLLNPIKLIQYFLTRKGPLTSPGCEAIGFLSTGNTTSPDIQFMVLPVGITADRGSHLKKYLRITDDVWNNYFVKSFDKYTASILPILLRPKSRGDVKIIGSNPSLPPQINYNHFSEREDLEKLIKGLEFVFKFVKTNAMRGIGADINRIVFPGCQHLSLFSKDYLECYIRHLTLTSFHPVGTCRMGLSPEDSVVSTEFKVFGIDKLFVVDGSVLPTIPSGNVNAAIAMMANIFFENLVSKNTGHCLKFDEFIGIVFQKCFQS